MTALICSAVYYSTEALGYMEILDPSYISKLENFHRIGPLGRFDQVVAMSVCLFDV